MSELVSCGERVERWSCASERADLVRAARWARGRARRAAPCRGTASSRGTAPPRGTARRQGTAQPRGRVHPQGRVHPRGTAPR